MHLEVSLLRERMVPLRDLSWQFFTLTGSVDAYLLYKDMERLKTKQHEPESPPLHPEETDGDVLH